MIEIRGKSSFNMPYVGLCEVSPRVCFSVYRSPDGEIFFDVRGEDKDMRDGWINLDLMENIRQGEARACSEWEDEEECLEMFSEKIRDDFQKYLELRKEIQI